jgi:biopolymer transport protein ExbD
MRRGVRSTGLEGAPDIMLLTMAALMVAIVWLVSHAHERTLPRIDLPKTGEARLGVTSGTSVAVTLRPRETGGVEVYVEDEQVPEGLEGLEAVLRSSGASELVLRADASTRWEDSLAAMSTAAKLGLPLAVAGSNGRQE